MRRWLYREDGNATIEFVFLFPVLMTLFLVVFETGLVMIRGVMLDRAVDISMRDLRLGTLNPMTQDGLRTAICNNSVIIPDCQNVVLIELRPISTTTWAQLDGPTTCVNRNEEIQPVLDFIPGLQNEMMLVRVCAIFDPFFPSTGLAAQMKLDASGGYALVAMSAYVNEP
ncbi:MAG: TadE/TadG family type IV pilus assembly protein [Paracoccaceae bacterium]